jgi:bifunctional UDP-N-acetylglucosamine pyrophosphorylase / glucosamine-1-phosphate N-acetyltransferase
MENRSIAAVVLAAGKGTRLKSDLPKVLHPLFGKPLLVRVLDTLASIQPQTACVVLGHGREQVSETLKKYEAAYPLKTVVQEPQLGTGHALLQVRQALTDWTTFQGDVVILSGDAPLLEPDSLKVLVETHQRDAHDLTVMAATLDNPFGYGRVILEDGRVARIVEEKDANALEKQVPLINTGIYCLNWAKISPLLDKLSNANAQGEFYLTDVIALAVSAGYSVGISRLSDPDESLGVNSRADLAHCHTVLNQRTLHRLMRDGVTILDPASTFIAPEVSIGADTTVLPGCFLQGNVTIGRRCAIGPYTSLSGTVTLGDDVRVIYSVIRDSRIGDASSVGPFSQLRDDVQLSHDVHIGNFVEIKKTIIDHHTNAAHLSYLGDAVLGSQVNIGAGTITANFDPIRETKSVTTIEDGAKIGSNSVLVAPVTIGESSSVAAGSVITRDVDPHDLAIARARQTEIPGWVRRVTGQKVP